MPKGVAISKYVSMYIITMVVSWLNYIICSKHFHKEVYYTSSVKGHDIIACNCQVCSATKQQDQIAVIQGRIQPVAMSKYARHCWHQKHKLKNSMLELEWILWTTICGVYLLDQFRSVRKAKRKVARLIASPSKAFSSSHKPGFRCEQALLFHWTSSRTKAQVKPVLLVICSPSWARQPKLWDLLVWAVWE